MSEMLRVQEVDQTKLPCLPISAIKFVQSGLDSKRHMMSRESRNASKLIRILGVLHKVRRGGGLNLLELLGIAMLLAIVLRTKLWIKTRRIEVRRWVIRWVR